MRRISLIGVALVGIMGLCGFFLQSSPPAVQSGIPGPAAAAGFTQQIINADFSQSSYKNLANWLYNCGGSLPTWTWTTVSTSSPAPCSHIDLENDSSIGNKQVLHLQYQPTDGQDQWQLAYPAVPYGPGSNNLNFPIAFYFQVTFRYGASGLTQQQQLSVGGGDHIVGGGHNSWIEPDYFELRTNTNTGSGWTIGDSWIEYHNCVFPNCPGGGGALDNYQLDVSAYHTLGVLFTTDGSTNYWKCYYLDGVAQAQGCTGGSVASGADLTTHDYAARLNIGPGSSQPALGTNLDMYVQNIQVWTCPGAYGTTTVTCGGPVITH